ncbi:MAG TPA: hypothetical protein PLN03_13620 [Spirochaetota bacterium]|nr:hypothetical protein [Spirochaetota bacterium]
MQWFEIIAADNSPESGSDIKRASFNNTWCLVVGDSSWNLPETGCRWRP